MGATPEEQDRLAKQIKEAESKVTVGGTYVHYKGSDKLYTVLALGFVESNLELCVIYRAEYAKRLTFIRPLSVWLETVDWNGQTVPRFSKL